MRARFDRADRRIARWMGRYGHFVHRLSLGALFVWFGALKAAGVPTATSLIAHVVYWNDPALMVPLLGWWEVAIGACLIVRPLVRVALLLLAVRLPGTVLALVLLPEVSFVAFPFSPSLEGQYLIKDVVLLGAALVIGSTVRQERDQAG